jgi:hypothetical protein
MLLLSVIIFPHRSGAEEPKEIAFKLDKTKGILFLDTRVAPPQRQRFDIALGSVTLETIGVKDGKLIFHYKPEVEGGYTVYECTVEVSPTPVTFDISKGVPGATSLDLKKCKVIGQGAEN